MSAEFQASTAKVNFADTVTRLGKVIEASMASLYDLQTATINAQNQKSASFSGAFRSIRQTLRAEWETLMAFFKSCHAFGEDIAFLKESLGKESLEDCLNFLQDLGVTSAELVDTAENLRKTINTPVILFNQKRDDILDLFGKTSSVPPQMRLEASPHDGNNTTIPVHRDNETASFVDSALASLYPNGKSTFFATENHFRGMLMLYDDVVTFWKTQHGEFLAGSKSKTGITISRVNQIAEEWATSKKALTATISVVSRACDAVGVEAKGAPRLTTPYQPVQLETSALGITLPHSHSWAESGRAMLVGMSSRLPTLAWTNPQGQISPAQTMSVKPNLAGAIPPSGKDCKAKSSRFNPKLPPRRNSNSAVKVGTSRVDSPDG